jgi:hypothetical protein
MLPGLWCWYRPLALELRESSPFSSTSLRPAETMLSQISSSCDCLQRSTKNISKRPRGPREISRKIIYTYSVYQESIIWSYRVGKKGSGQSNYVYITIGSYKLELERARNALPVHMG